MQNLTMKNLYLIGDMRKDRLKIEQTFFYLGFTCVGLTSGGPAQLRVDNTSAWIKANARL